MGLGNTRVHGSAEQDLVFIVHGHHNEEFCLSAIEIRSEAVLGTHEIVRVAGCGSVAHLGHFLDVVHALWNNMRGDFDVEYKVAVLQFYVSHRPALHEFFPGYRVAGAHSRRGHRKSEIWRWRIIRLVREGRGDHLILVMRVKVSLRMSGMDGPIGLCLPVVFVVVMVGMVGCRRWRVIRSGETCRRLVVERIVVLIVSHEFKGGDWLCSTEREMVVDGRVV